MFCMVRKRSKRIKSKTQKSTDILTVCILIVIMVVFTLYAVHDIVLCVHTSSGRNCEYIGSFELSESRRTRNTTYKFTLANGDVITADSSMIEKHQSLDEFDELKFSYTSFRNIPFFAYTAVSITTVDGEISFLSVNDTIAEAKLGIGVFAVIIGIIVLVIIAWCAALMWLDGTPKRRK